MGLYVNISEKNFGKKNIFKDLVLTFPDKGLYAIVGKSGIGKTTLLRIIAGLDKKFKGKVQGGGTEKCSYVFQEYRLFPQLNALDNVLIANYDNPTDEQKREAVSLLEELSFSKDDLLLFPDELSGGMKQRLSIVRALIRKAPVLLLDEPTKELDRDICERLYKILKRESEKRLLLMISHSEKDIERTNAEIINL